MKTGTDLRVARSIANITQGQLGAKARIPAKTIQCWEAKDNDLPEWAVERMNEVLEWPTPGQIAQELGQVYLIQVSGMTDLQFRTKLKGLGRYVESAVRVDQEW